MSAPNRPDLLSLGPEELELFSNRGTVRRAGADLGDPKLGAIWETGEDGSFTAVWSDGAKVSFPAAGTLRDARCTCPASASSTGVCRHVIRTVLALREAAGNEPTAGNTAATGTSEAASGESDAAGASNAAGESWNPGSITDDDLAVFCSPANLARARALVDEGLLVEVLLREKPLVRIHGMGTTVRFLVRGDVRYAKADVEGPAAEQAAAIAVMAARRLPPGRESGWVQTGSDGREIPTELFADTDKALSELFAWGISRVGAAYPATLRNLAARHTEAGLAWLADALEEAAFAAELYQSRDALFSPEAVADSVAEWLARRDAFCGAGDIPWMLVGGTRFDRERDLARLRLTGLGSSVRPYSRGVTLIAWLLDEDTGSVLTVEKSYPDPAEGEPRDFSALAALPALPGVRFEDLASGRLIGSGGHASASGRLSPGRKASVSPQTFSWEKLRDGFLVEDYRELAAEAESRPPAFLSSRRRGEDIVALKVASVGEASFDHARQEIRFVARDANGATVQVALPWLSRGSKGLEGLLARLADPEWKPLFLSGSLRTTARGPEIVPVALVFDVAGERIMLQPWIEGRSPSAAAQPTAAPSTDTSTTGTSATAERGGAVKGMLATIQEAAGETLLIGEKGHGRELAALWLSVARHAESRGSALFAGKSAALASAFEASLHGLEASDSETVFTELLVLALTGKHLA